MIIGEIDNTKIHSFIFHVLFLFCLLRRNSNYPKDETFNLIRRNLSIVKDFFSPWRITEKFILCKAKLLFAINLRYTLQLLIPPVYLCKYVALLMLKNQNFFMQFAYNQQQHYGICY